MNDDHAELMAARMRIYQWEDDSRGERLARLDGVERESGGALVSRPMQFAALSPAMVTLVGAVAVWVFVTRVPSVAPVAFGLTLALLVVLYWLRWGTKVTGPHEAWLLRRAGSRRTDGEGSGLGAKLIGPSMMVRVRRGVVVHRVLLHAVDASLELQDVACGDGLVDVEVAAVVAPRRDTRALVRAAVASEVAPLAVLGRAVVAEAVAVVVHGASVQLLENRAHLGESLRRQVRQPLHELGLEVLDLAVVQHAVKPTRSEAG